MQKSRKRLIIMAIVSVILIIGFIPKISEKTITENSEYVLNMHNYSKISEYGDYYTLFNQRDYIVRK
jgi:NADH:ubiquinone oxidoreductase subunit 4 (subunit M)